MSLAYELRPFGAGSRPPAEDLARLHAALLPASPIALLGTGFLNRYYRCLPQSDCLFGAVAYYDGGPAGFVAATADSDRFLANGLRGDWSTLGWALARALAARPSQAAVLGEAWSIGRTRREAAGRQPVGEILSMGVLPAYRNPGFVRASGLRIAQDLFEKVCVRLRRSGTARVRAIIDADNLPAQFFYRVRGWRLAQRDVPGWRVPSVEFVGRL